MKARKKIRQFKKFAERVEKKKLFEVALIGSKVPWQNGVHGDKSKNKQRNQNAGELLLGRCMLE
jgi:hypothetical protein